MNDCISPPLTIRRLCLDLENFAGGSRRPHRLKPVARWLQRALGTQEEQPFDRLLHQWCDRVWPEGVRVPVIVANLRKREHGGVTEFSARLRADTSRGCDPCASFEQRTLAFHVFRGSGRLAVRHIELSWEAPRRQSERVVVGPVFRDDAAYMDDGDFDILDQVPAARAQMRRRLAPYRDYLEWQIARVEKTRVTVPYRERRLVESGGQRLVEFVVSCADDASRIAGEPRLEAARPEPRARDRDRAVRLGEPVEHGPVARKGTSREQPASSEPVHGFVRVEIERPTSVENIPTNGVLQTDLALDLAPFQLQRRALDRVERGEAHMEGLVDALENPGASRGFGDPTESIFLPSDEERDPTATHDAQLNLEQQAAVNMIVRGRSYSLIQGPPGTGKTAVIAAACEQLALDGKRVLVTSQSNLAVSNVLERLSTKPQIRPLRVGNPDRIDDRFRRFTRDEAHVNWLRELRAHWRSQLEILAQRKARVSDRRRALNTLTAIANEHGSLRAALERTGDEAREMQREVGAQRSRIRVAEDNLARVRGELERLDVFMEWLMSDCEGPTPPVDAVQRWFDACGVSASSATWLEEVPASKIASENLEAFESCLGEIADCWRALSRKGDPCNDARLRWAHATRNVATAGRQVWRSQPPEVLKRVAASLGPDEIDAADLDALRVALQDARKRSAAATRRIEGMFDELGTLQSSYERDRSTAMNMLDEETAKYETLEDQWKQRREARNAATRAVERARESWSTAWAELTDAEVPPIEPGAPSTVADDVRAEEAALECEQAQSLVQREVLQRLLRDADQFEEGDRGASDAWYRRHANVVGATCHASGTYQFLEDFEPFDVVIVDEVSKTTRTELLVPLLLGKRFVLVGDHRQLPPMFRDQDASYTDAVCDELLSPENLEKYREFVTSSVFREMFEAAPASQKIALVRQYRMHPDIMDCCNHFYDEPLRCGLGEREVQAAARAHGLIARDPRGGDFVQAANALLWVDTSRTADGTVVRDELRGTSRVNTLEARSIVAGIELIARALHTANADNVREIGVISLYGAQLGCIERHLGNWKRANPDLAARVNVRLSSVDRFQGAECPIIFASLVRAGGRPSRFARDYRRINVAMSRAQELLVIVGALKTWSRVPVGIDRSDGSVRHDAVFQHIGQRIQQLGGVRRAVDLLGEA